MRRALPLLGVSLLFLSACHARENPARFEGAPIFIISIDTLRSDHLAAYGYRGVETPRIDAFRREAILFERAYSPSPLTLPAHVSMLTGRLPFEHGVRDNIGFRYDGAGDASLPELLRRKGYATGAAVSAYVLRRETGLGALFDFYEDAIPPKPGAIFDTYERPGAQTVDRSIQWIGEQKGKPIFFLLHLYEPHAPYEPPEPFRSRYASSPYDGEIAAVDEVVGRFLDALRAMDLYDRSTIIVVSDHGEGLGDHGEEQHGVLLYRELIQVPLLIKLPAGARGGETVKTPVQLPDLAPTLAALAGAEGLEPTESARDILARGGTSERGLYAESINGQLLFGWSPLRSLIQWPHHYIESPKPELYDLAADPAERRNVLAAERRTAARFREALAALPRGDETPGPVDPETAERLAALGYIGRPRTFQAGGALPNPVEQIGLLEKIRHAFALTETGTREEGEGALRAVLAINPSMPEARMRLAELLAAHGEIDGAIAEYRIAIDAVGGAFPDLFVNLASLYLRKGSLDEAESHARLALAALPARAHEMLGRIALERGDLATADREAASAVGAGAHPSALLLQAEIAIRRGDLASAFALLGRASARVAELRLGGLPRLELVRGDALARAGRLDEAAGHLRAEIDAYPAALEAYRNLAVVHYLRRDRAAADAVLREMEGKNPTAEARELGRRTRAFMQR